MTVFNVWYDDYFGKMWIKLFDHFEHRLKDKLTIKIDEMTRFGNIVHLRPIAMYVRRLQNIILKTGY